MKKHIVLLPGDVIEPEILVSSVAILKAIAKKYDHQFSFEEHLIRGAALDEVNDPLPEKTLEAAKKADAILLGAVGGPKWDHNPSDLRPERGLLAIRKALEIGRASCREGDEIR